MEDAGSEPFGAVNWTVCVLLLLVSVLIGLFSSLRGRGTNTINDYLFGGRQMSPLPVALSLIGSTISAISILGLASEMYYYGTQYVLILVGSFYGILFLQFLIVPILYRLDILSVNEYITLRFGSPGLRKLTSASLIIDNIIYNGICLYAPSLTLSTVTGLSSYYSITTMGIICSLFISVGGVKAIVYTDAVQTLFMFLGIISAVTICVMDLGGLANVFDTASAGGRIEFFNFDPSLYVRYTFWSVQFQGLHNMISWLGVSQMGYMRFASVPSLGAAKRLCSYYFVGLSALWLTFFFSGIVAYATYSGCDPLTSGRIDEPDQILPYLVVRKVSRFPGMAGLFAAAVYSGMLSSVSSYANSTASLIWQDVLSGMSFFKGYSDKAATRMLKIISAVIGVLAIGFAMLVKHLGSIVTVTSSFSNAISAAKLGIFIAGMFAPWVSAKGAYAGFLTAFAFNMWFMIGQFINGQGQSEKLPLSTEGCPESLHRINSTSVLLLNDAPDNQTFSPQMFEYDPHEEQMEKSIYDLSYCYTGFIGVTVCYIVASLTSLLTGPLEPPAVDAQLIDPRSLKLYKRLWGFFSKSVQSDNFDFTDTKVDSGPSTTSSTPL